jgi:hypothetical protein|tara:strand:- start:43 stop:216 length:174 start_codon:yes stop_codon:yes gene_type:complete
MKSFKITESFTGYVEYEVIADTKEEAIKLYEDGDYKETDIDGTDRYDYKFHSIEENN